MAFRFAAAFMGLVSTFGASPPLWAKGSTIRIEISGGSLTSPIRITDAKRLEEFTFWDGPGMNGVRLGNAERGSIIDWKTGIVAQHPAHLQRYEMSFTADFGLVCQSPYDPSRCALEEPRVIYVLIYEYDPSSKRGFVYLPGEGEPWHDWNIFTLYRPDAEGHWFLATDAWTNFAEPLIATAQRRNH
jgi:hypothetical protein